MQAFCSRREADEFITAGVVSVNGQVVTELGTKIKRGDEVKFHDQVVNIERKIYVLLNKPKDTVTTSDDPQARRTVMDLVKGACEERIYPVGRLDRNTTGVLLLTNDGDLASKLTHPKYLKKKIYHVHLDKNLTKADMEQIAAGIQLMMVKSMQTLSAIRMKTRKTMWALRSTRARTVSCVVFSNPWDIR